MSVNLKDNVIIPSYFGCLLYVRKRHEYIPYDTLTTEVLTHCLTQPLKDLPHTLSHRVEPWQRDAFYRLGRKMGFMDRAGRFKGVMIDGKKPPEGHLPGPLTLHLSVTQSCDLSCTHCFASGEMSDAGGEQLRLEELEGLFKEAAGMGCMRTALTGGEPLNRGDVFELMDMAPGHGIDVCMTTNGMRVDAHVSRELSKRPFAWVNVSLEGATPATNDAVRGKGTFDKVTRNIKKHLKWRVPFGLSITLNRVNVHEIPLFKKLARELGAEVVMLRGCYPVGRARGSNDLCLDLDEYEEAISRLRLTGCDVKVVPSSCEAGDMDDLAVVHDNFGCAAGNTVASVSYSGDVSPCSLITGGLHLDNIRDMGLGEIWSMGQGFRDIRSLEAPSMCRECVDYSICSGGCRARAWAERGSLDVPDTWCRREMTDPGIC